MVLCSNNAKSCFDRIVHAVALMALRRLGLPIPPIKSMLEAFQQVEHHVQTAYGNSDNFMTALLHEIPFQGVGQGNAAATTIWATISLVLLQMLKEEGFGASIITPLTQELIQTVGFAFVDDADLIQSALNSSKTIHSVMEKMQQMLNLWEGALKATGGALDPNKSFIYAIDYKLQNGKWEYVDNVIDSEMGIFKWGFSRFPPCW